MIQVLDIISAIAVIIALFSVTKNPKMWLLYATGCVGYIIINFTQGLPGQGVLNILAMGLAVMNYRRLVNVGTKRSTNNAVDKKST